MSESKTLIFPDAGSGNGMLGLLAPLMQRSGIDPNLLLAMNNRGGGFGGEGGWFIWVIFLFFLMGWGNNGFFGGNGANGVPGLINNDAGRELLMSAIQGNGNAINQLASTLNCSVGQIQQAINSVMSQVQQVGNQVGQSSMQVINAIQAGNCQIAQQIAQCCCDNRLALCQQTNTLQGAINGVNVGMERGFSSVAFETQRQTCDITGTIRDTSRQSTDAIIARLDAAEKREMQRELNAKDEKIAALTTQIGFEHQNHFTAQAVAQAVAPANAALADLGARLAKIECKQPETVNVPYSPVVGVPTCVAAQYGFNTPGNGFWG